MVFLARIPDLQVGGFPRRVARLMLGARAMTTALSEYLLDLASKYARSAVGCVRRGVRAVGSLLGSVPGLVRPLLQRALAFVARKVAPVAAAARDSVRDALESLKRRAEAVLRGTSNKSDASLDEDELPAEAAVASAPSSAGVSAPAGMPVTTRSNSNPSSDSAPPRPRAVDHDTTSESPGIVDLAPALGRALVRVLQHPRGASRTSRPVRAMPRPPSSLVFVPRENS